MVCVIGEDLLIEICDWIEDDSLAKQAIISGMLENHLVWLL